MENCLEDVIKSSQVFVIGDLNVDLNKATTCCKRLFHSLATYGLSLYNKQATQLNSLIDVIFHNNNNNIDKTIATLIVPFLDHNFLSLCISKFKKKNSYQKQTINSNSVKYYIENLTKVIPKKCGHI